MTVLGMTRAAAEARAMVLLDKVGLADKGRIFRRRCRRQQQRVAIARALAMEPEVMLLTNRPRRWIPKRLVRC